MASGTPVDVSGMTTGVTALSRGSSNDYLATDTCGITSAGAASCWGQNDHGQLGNATTKDSSTPVSVSGLTKGIIAIAVGGSHTCALTKAGGVKCWGLNDSGELGDGSLTESPIPVDVEGF